MIALWMLLGIVVIVYLSGYCMMMLEYFRLLERFRPVSKWEAFRVALYWPISMVLFYIEERKREEEWKAMLREKYPTAYKVRYGVDPREE